MQATRKDAIVDSIKFYKALGITYLPFDIGEARENSQEEKAEALKRLRKTLGDCHRCKLSGERTNIVFGEGNPSAELMLIGISPSRFDDIEGRLFMGETGDMLKSLLGKLGFKPEDVYISNMVKCYPANDRFPNHDEITACLPFITTQIQMIRPKVIMTMGEKPAHTLLGTNTPMDSLRGKFDEFNGIPVMPTFHPAYLLKNREEKMKVWTDGLNILKLLGRQLP